MSEVQYPAEYENTAIDLLRYEYIAAQARVIKPGSREEAWADRNYRGDLVAGDWLPSSWVC